MDFTQWLNRNWEKGNMFPPELEPQKALNFLVDYLLGKDWYSTLPGNGYMVNADIVGAILMKYSKRYQKEIKKRR